MSKNAVKVVQQKGISIVWLVPIIALIFGAWLVFKAVNEQGEFITIEFESGRGIVPNKTEVRYKGLVAGMVKSVVPSKDLQHVLVDVEMSEQFSPYLTEKTLFWLVTADVSLQGISGLDTLLSGDYINMKPDLEGDADSSDSFVALNEAPPLDLSTPGLHLTLETDVLGSISNGSLVSFKQIPIGYVSGYHYAEQRQKVAINIFIEQEYAHLVKENSHFWNSSGVQVVASLSSGIKVNTDSLGSIMAGGISVGTLPYQTPEGNAKNRDVFELFPDFQSAEMGHEIELVLGWNSGLDRGSAILYQGVTIGVIDAITSIDPKAQKVLAKAKVNPRIVPYLTNESQFYVVSPSINLSGVSNASSLLTGNYISIRPSLAGEKTRKFIVYNEKPAYKYTEAGLHLILETNNRDSLQAGSNIYFKQQAVGTIQAVETLAPEQHLVHIHINEKHQKYVNADSHFWNNSGVKISANLQGLNIEVQSLQSVLTGGISFDQGAKSLKEAKSSNNMPNNGDKFILYDNKSLAEQRVTFTLLLPADTTSNSNVTVKAKTRLRYQGRDIGSVHQVIYNKDQQLLTVGLLPEYAYILNDHTRFWLVQAQLSLSGITDTEALFAGNYITFDTLDESLIQHGKNNIQAVSNITAKHRFILSTTPPEKPASSSGLQLRLIADNGNAASSGSPLTYKGIVVGRVDNVVLHSQQGDKTHVDINATVDDKYRHLVTVHSRFYSASGIIVSGGLTDFVVKTESADTMLRGGISFYNPDNEYLSTLPKEVIAVKEKDKFTLFKHLAHARSAGLTVTVAFDDVSGLKENAKVLYQNQTVGVVDKLIFQDNTISVTALILLNDYGRKFAVAGSKFWFASSEIGLVGSKNIGSIIDGGHIGLIPGKVGDTVKTSFIAEDLPPVIEALPFGLNLQLVTNQRGSVRVGNPVLYRQVKVGHVIGVGLSDTADKVNVFINIAKKYAPLVTNESQFWNTSGFSVEAGIFAGVDIDSESIETLIAGGIAFATPESSAQDVTHNAVSQGQHFTLHKKAKDDWKAWQPKIKL